MRRSALAACGLSVGLASLAAAHEVRPAYLELRELGAELHEVFWKVPGRGDGLRLGLYVELPENCVALSEPRALFVSGSFSERWRVGCRGGLAGRTIRVAGLAATLTDVLVRVGRLDGTSQVARLTPAEPSFAVAAAPGWRQVAATYLGLGFEHILLGLDHLLFVLALLLLARGVRPLVWTISAFTAAHSITLGATALGWLRVPTTPVEICIALSIAFAAAEIVHQRSGRPGLGARRPWALALGFGLLHGFGFAGALGEIGLPQGAISAALLFFNLGVEAGQLAFIAAVLAIAALARRLRMPWPAWAWRLPAYAIGSAAAFWAVQRIAQS
jgi:hydrogenase/urease accessory protein HupE